MWLGAHIVFSDLCLLATIWHWVSWDLEIFCDEHTGNFLWIIELDLKIVRINFKGLFSVVYLIS